MSDASGIAQSERKSSYDIGYMYLIALIGGAWPLFWLGARNAKNLEVDYKIIRILSSITLGLFTMKILMIFGLAAGLIPFSRTHIRVLYRCACFISAGAYFKVMSVPYGHYVNTGGKPRSIMYDFVIAMIASIVIEAAFIVMALFLGGLYARF